MRTVVGPRCSFRVAMLCCLVLATVTACGRSEQVQSLAKDMLQAGSGTASPPQRTVVPSKPPVEMQSLRIEDERYLGEIARQLGTTVDAIRAANQLGEGPLTAGMVLQVEASREAVDRYCALREQRKANQIAQAEAKRQAKLRAEAEARAAKRAKHLAARARKRGEAVAQPGAHVPGVPLRPGEARVVGQGQVRGLTLPAGLSQ